MNIKTNIIALLLLASCKKEVEVKEQPTCDCYERHEVKMPVQGGFEFQLDYNTSLFKDFCSKEMGQWIYTGNASQYRYKTICN